MQKAKAKDMGKHPGTKTLGRKVVKDDHVSFIWIDSEGGIFALHNVGMKSFTLAIF